MPSMLFFVGGSADMTFFILETLSFVNLFHNTTCHHLLIVWCPMTLDVRQAMSLQCCHPDLASLLLSAIIQESAAGVSASRSSDEVQAAYSALLEQALSHLQLLGVESASAKHSKKKAQERLYALLEALAKVSILSTSWLQNCLFNLQS